MKKTKILYWLFTALFAASMIFTAIPDIMVTAETKDFMHMLGYPEYFTPFIGWMKILGCIAILIPGFPRIKEWAYAGLFFDLFGATYSAISVMGFMPQMAGMLIWYALFVLSYVYFHKMQQANTVQA